MKNIDKYKPTKILAINLISFILNLRIITAQRLNNFNLNPINLRAQTPNLEVIITTFMSHKKKKNKFLFNYFPLETHRIILT